jgi:hypothetical protein
VKGNDKGKYAEFAGIKRAGDGESPVEASRRSSPLSCRLKSEVGCAGNPPLKG